MVDPSLVPTIAHPSATQHLAATDAVSLSDIISADYEGEPEDYVFPFLQALGDDTTPIGNPKLKRAGSLTRKRSGWNAFYKEQFAIYHADNPPETKQNARDRKGFSSYASGIWKQLSPQQKEAYVKQAEEDDALAVSRPVGKMRRKRAGLLETLGRIVAELETEFGVESLLFWSERDSLAPLNVNPPPSIEGEAYGMIGSTTGIRYIEFLSNARLGPHQYTRFIQAHPPAVSDDTQPPLIGSRKRKSIEPKDGPLDTYASTDEPSDDHLKKKSKSNISRDYYDAEFRRSLLYILNSNLPPEAQKTRLPRGFFGPFLENLGMELVGLPEKPVEINASGKIGGWSADALRKNLEAVRDNRVYIRSIGQGNGANDEICDTDEVAEVKQERNEGKQEQEAAMILAKSAGGNH